MNDRFGIQMRGGTYGHYLLHVDRQHSSEITNSIGNGDLSTKPGWVRLSIHPTTTNDEVEYILDALGSLRKNIKKWQNDYKYNVHSNEFHHRKFTDPTRKLLKRCFEL